MALEWRILDMRVEKKGAKFSRQSDVWLTSFLRPKPRILGGGQKDRRLLERDLQHAWWLHENTGSHIPVYYCTPANFVKFDHASNLPCACKKTNTQLLWKSGANSLGILNNAVVKKTVICVQSFHLSFASSCNMRMAVANWNESKQASLKETAVFANSENFFWATDGETKPQTFYLQWDALTIELPGLRWQREGYDVYRFVRHLSPGSWMV